MGLSRLLGGWLAVVVWLLVWELVASRFGSARSDGRLRGARVHLGEALILALLGGLWFGSLGSGEWWLVFGLVGVLREWPAPRWRLPAERPDPISIGLALLRVVRTMVAGGLLAWRLAPA
jgi:hypothetical protein